MTRCAVLGATGIAGQQFIAALQQHPFIEVAKLAASSRSAGKTYQEALTQEGGNVAWLVDGDIPAVFAGLTVEDAASLSTDGIDVVFCAVESAAARELEQRLAKEVPVISTASAHRYEHDVPILIPAVNGHHADLIAAQRKNRGWRGFVVPIPNCTTTGMAIALAPLHANFGIEKVVMTSMQAASGAGRSPGVVALDIVDNIIPFISKEEEKVEKETKKILGMLAGDVVEPAPFEVSATCTRVPVLDGHTEVVNVSFKKPATLAEVKAALRGFGKEINPNTHPSAPRAWVTVYEDPYRPQVRRDRDADGGMTTSVGRLREDHILGAHGVKFLLVSHNTKMGAAKGAILVAEDLKIRGLL